MPSNNLQDKVLMIARQSSIKLMLISIILVYVTKILFRQLSAGILLFNLKLYELRLL